MAKQIGDLRDALFDTLDQLRDKANPMDLDRAKAVAEVAQVIINSAKVEVEFMRQRGNDRGTGFIPDEPELPTPGQPRLIKGHAQSGSR
jgi:hypothetical protein